MFRLSVVLGLAALVPGLLLCQVTPPHQQAAEETSEPYTLRVTAQTVVLDVVVTDRGGHLVTNLGKGDFHVYEDHVSQAITSFEAPTSERSVSNTPIGSTAQLDRVAPNAPVDIIVLDEIGTVFEDEAFARYSLKKFLDSQGGVLSPTMLVAVNLQRFMVLKDFTTSKDEILGALNHHLIEYPWQAKSPSWKGEQFNAAFNSLIEVAQATSGHKGRKTMIWIGRGFPTFDPLSLAPPQAQELKTAIETCTNALRDARVVLYTLDPTGISAEDPAEDQTGFFEKDPFGGQVDFDTMARATGGRAFGGRNDIDHLIVTSVQEGAEFYTLSYTPSSQHSDSKPFRNIQVVMRDPNLRATTREGYYPMIADAPAKAEDANGKISGRLVFDLTTAGQGLMVYDAVPITIIRDASSPDKFVLRLRSADLPWQQANAGQLTADVTILVESFDRKGKLLDRSAKITTLGVEAASGQMLPSKPAIALTETVSTKPPAARLRFVVRVNGDGKIGAQNYFLVDSKALSDPSTGLKSSR